jgi:hypothetical protein
MLKDLGRQEARIMTVFEIDIATSIKSARW